MLFRSDMEALEAAQGGERLEIVHFRTVEGKTLDRRRRQWRNVRHREAGQPEHLERHPGQRRDVLRPRADEIEFFQGHAFERSEIFHVGLVEVDLAKRGIAG